VEGVSAQTYVLANSLARATSADGGSAATASEARGAGAASTRGVTLSVRGATADVVCVGFGATGGSIVAAPQASNIDETVAKRVICRRIDRISGPADSSLDARRELTEHQRLKRRSTMKLYFNILSTYSQKTLTAFYE